MLRDQLNIVSLRSLEDPQTKRAPRCGDEAAAAKPPHKCSPRILLPLWPARPIKRSSRVQWARSNTADNKGRNSSRAKQYK
jgi:hypothetical protein